MLDEPMRVAEAAAGLAEQMDGLLPHVGEELRNDLLAARAAWAAVPANSSVLEPVAPRPLAERDKALSEGLARLTELSTVTPGLHGRHASRARNRVAAIRGEMRYLVGQAQAAAARYR